MDATDCGALGLLMPKGSALNTVRKLACALPGVEEEGAAAGPAFKVKGKLFAWFRDDPNVLAVKVSPISRPYLLQAQPTTFFLTDHYRNYPIVLVRLPRIGRRQLAEVLEEAWREVAPARLRAAYDTQRGRGAARP